MRQSAHRRQNEVICLMDKRRQENQRVRDQLLAALIEFAGRKDWSKVTVTELTDKLGVSLVTIRQDLKKLEERGVLKRTHGGAVPVVTGYDISTRMWNHYEDKLRIAQAAARASSSSSASTRSTPISCWRSTTRRRVRRCSTSSPIAR